MEFAGHVHFEQCARDRMAFSLHVLRKCRDDAVGFDSRIPQRGGQIEQVAPLLALIQRPQLGPQEFIELVGIDLAAPLEPARRNAEGDLLEAVDGEMLPRSRPSAAAGSVARPQNRTGRRR